MKLYISQIKLKPVDDYSNYPFSLPAVKNLDCIDLIKRVTFLIGENGCGKSTLLEAIAVQLGFNPEGGSKNFNFSTTQTHSELYKYITLVKRAYPKNGYFLRAESFYNVASEIDYLDSQPAASPHIIDSYGGKSLHHQSHGESFFSLIMNRFSPDGLYLLDEPEAALSPQRQLALLSRIHELVKADSQFIIATHSPILLAYPDSEIYSLTDKGIIKTEYKNTDSYIITKKFLTDTDNMLKQLLD